MWVVTCKDAAGNVQSYYVDNSGNSYNVGYDANSGTKLTISEEQAVGLHEGDELIGTTVADHKQIRGKIRLLTQAPGFADLKQSREKGQADLSAFQVRIYIDASSGAMPGQTIGVDF